MRGDSFLDRMASASRDRVSLARARESDTALRARATAVADTPALRLGEFDLIIFDRYKRRGILPTLYLDNIRDYVERGGAVLVAAVS